MTITFVVEKAATGGITLKVVTVGADIKKEQTQTVTIRSETAAFEPVKSRVSNCLEKGSNRTYLDCFNQAYKELGLTQPTTGIHAHPERELNLFLQERPEQWRARTSL